MNIKKLWKIIFAIAFTIIMIFTGLWICTTFFNIEEDVFVILAYVSAFVIGGLYITGRRRAVRCLWGRGHTFPHLFHELDHTFPHFIPLTGSSQPHTKRPDAP